MTKKKINFNGTAVYPWAEKLVQVNAYLEEITGKNPLAAEKEKVVTSKIPSSAWYPSQDNPDAQLEKDASI